MYTAGDNVTQAALRKCIFYNSLCQATWLTTIHHIHIANWEEPFTPIKFLVAFSYLEYEIIQDCKYHTEQKLNKFKQYSTVQYSTF